MASLMTAWKAGSLVVLVLDSMKMSSDCSSIFVEKPSSTIRSALAASPTLLSDSSMFLVPTAMPMANDATTKASQPITAVFQWLALQRPIRAAK